MSVNTVELDFGSEKKLRDDGRIVITKHNGIRRDVGVGRKFMFAADSPVVSPRVVQPNVRDRTSGNTSIDPRDNRALRDMDRFGVVAAH